MRLTCTTIQTDHRAARAALASGRVTGGCAGARNNAVPESNVIAGEVLTGPRVEEDGLRRARGPRATAAQYRTVRPFHSERARVVSLYK